jgi:hypothetical protein
MLTTDLKSDELIFHRYSPFKSSQYTTPKEQFEVTMGLFSDFPKNNQMHKIGGYRSVQF